MQTIKQRLILTVMITLFATMFSLKASATIVYWGYVTNQSTGCAYEVSGEMWNDRNGLHADINYLPVSPGGPCGHGGRIHIDFISVNGPTNNPNDYHWTFNDWDGPALSTSEEQAILNLMIANN